MTSHRIATIVVVGVALLGAGCSVLAPIPDQSRYFTLTPASGIGDANAASEPSASSVVYGLGPIILPAYLDRTQVATRLSPTEVAYSQWDRWAEPLLMNVTSVLRQDLAAELGTDAIVAYPWFAGVRVEHQIEVRFLRFESDTTGESRLDARWAIRDAQQDHPLVVRDTSLSRQSKANDTSASTAALSDMVAELARDIAAETRNAPAAHSANATKARKRR